MTSTLKIQMKRPKFWALLSSGIIHFCLCQQTGLAQTKTNELPPPPVINHTLPQDIGDNLTINQVRVFGSAQTTKWKLLSQGEERTYLIVFGKNDDIIAGLYRFLDDTKMRSGHFSAIGAVGAAALGFFRPEDHTYKVTKVEEQAEVSSLTGTIGLKNGKPAVHAHGVLSLSDGHCLAGHIFYASVWPTVEMTVSESLRAPIRHPDDESGLWLYDAAAKGN